MSMIKRLSHSMIWDEIHRVGIIDNSATNSYDVTTHGYNTGHKLSISFNAWNDAYLHHVTRDMTECTKQGLQTLIG